MHRKRYQVALGIVFLLRAAGAQAPPAGESQRAPAKLAHPPVVLKDDAGRNVLESGNPVSTRQTCGEKCHDYEFITGSFHFQQGKTEMDRKLLGAHGVPAFNSSPGMFGKFSLIPNRQLTHAGITDSADADMSQPEWLTKCGGCHTGGGISEYDLSGRRLLTPAAKPHGTLDPSYTIRDRETGQPGSALGLGEKRRGGGGLLPVPRSQGQPRRAAKANGRGEFPLGEQRDAHRNGPGRRIG
jgi:hypothetical protein